MNWKLFFSTFLLIFLAELGDKTQLAAMARTATSGSKWTIFVAASVALVFSTLIAVLFGKALTRVIPERTIRIGAGVLFVLFGILILREALSRPRVPTGEVWTSPIAGPVLKLAAQFEAAAVDDYVALAAKAESPRLRALLETLAAEEKQHLERLRTASREHADVPIERPAGGGMPAAEVLTHDVASSDEPLLAHAREHEEATVGFYHELARLTPLPALRRTFELLAAEEEDHVRRLDELQGA